MSSAFEALTRTLRSRADVRGERELYRSRLARIAGRWSRADLDHIVGMRGQRELLLAAVQSMAAGGPSANEFPLSERVDEAVARALVEADPIDTEKRQPPTLRLIYSRPD